MSEGYRSGGDISLYKYKKDYIFWIRRDTLGDLEAGTVSEC